MSLKTTRLLFFLVVSLLLSFNSNAQQDNVLIIYNSSWGTQGTFNCVQDYAGANGNFTLCPMPNGTNVPAPPCVTNLCSYDVIMVQATYSSLDPAFIAQLIAYLQCGGNLYFQNDIGSGPQAQAQQNMNDLLAAIGQPPITLTQEMGSYPNQQPVIDVGTSGITNLCSISPLYYASGGLLSGPGLANAATVDLPIGTIAAFWQTPWGGVLGLGGEFYTSGNWSGSCLPGSGEMVWGFMSTTNPGCVTVLADFTPSSTTICAGDSITVTDVSIGDSLNAWNWVFNGGNPGSSTLQDPGFISYANPGTFDITLTVTDTSGVTDDTTMQITVTSCPPTASFSVIDTVCAGTPITVTDLSTSPTPIQTWAWDFTGGTPSSSTQQNPGNIVYNTAGNYNITLTVTSASGSDDTTITLVVIPCLPEASFSVIDTVCVGTPITVTDLSSAPTPIQTWDWDFTGGTPASSTQQNPGSIVYNTPGNYDITLTITSATGSDDTTITIVVESCPPIASFSVIDSICEGQPFTVTDLSTAPTPIQTWAWDFTGGIPSSSNQQNPGNIVYNTPGTYNITLTVTNASGSDDTTITVVILDCSPPTAIFAIPNDTICVNECFAPIDQSTSPLPIVQWDWTFSGGNPGVGNGQNPGNVCYNSPGLYDITLTVTNDIGLIDDTTIQVYVQSCNPTASFSVIDTVCAGDQVILTDLSTSQFGIQSWDWSMNGATPSSSNVQDPGPIVYNVPGVYNITLTVSDFSGSDDTTITLVVINCGLPTAIFSIPGDTLCPGDCITPIEMSVSPTPILTWTWNFTGGNPSSSDAQNPGTICYPNSGVFPITLTVTNIAGSHDTTLYVVVDNPPIANFGYTPPTPVENETVFLHDQSTGAVNWNWFINGENFDIQNPIISFEEPGTYPVFLMVESDAGCIDTITKYIYVEEELIYYVPNTFTPDADAFNNVFQPVFTSGFDPYDYQLRIYNRWGQLIFESNDPEIGWDGSYGSKGQISLVQGGIYTWTIEFKTILNDERKSINGHVNVMY